MHDRDGKLLKEGDTVLVPAIVRSLNAGDEYCNVTLVTVEKMFPGNEASTITLNTRQVVLSQANE